MTPFSVDPEKDTICDVIRRWARVQPESPALIGVDGEIVTYGALAEEMDVIRRRVAQSGFGQSDRIGIIHRGGVDLVAVILGVMSCATAVPLNPSFTEPEFRDHLRDRGVTALIAAPVVSVVSCAKRLLQNSLVSVMLITLVSVMLKMKLY